MHAETALYFMNNKTICKLPIYTPGIYAEGYTVFAFPFSVRVFVRSCVRHVRGIYHTFFTELCNSFSRGVYLMNQSSESTHNWTIGFPEGRLSFHDF